VRGCSRCSSPSDSVVSRRAGPASRCRALSYREHCLRATALLRRRCLLLRRYASTTIERHLRHYHLLTPEELSRHRPSPAMPRLFSHSLKTSSVVHCAVTTESRRANITGRQHHLQRTSALTDILPPSSGRHKHRLNSQRKEDRTGGRLGAAKVQVSVARA